MRAILIGAVESSRIALERITAADGWTCPLVLTLPVESSGRHSDFVDLEPEAAKGGAELLRIRNANDGDARAAIERLAPDAVFVVGWSQICGPEFRNACGQQVIGYHPAPLPRLRGRGVIPWTILNREPISGGTLFWIDEGVDSGPILAQRFFHVAPEETAGTLYAKHMAALSDMMDEALGAIASGTAPRLEQDERYATWAARRTPADGLVDWSCPAEEIALLIRAVGRPYPGAQTFDGPHRLVLWAGKPIAGGCRHSAVAGQVVRRGQGSFAVMCGDGGLLQIEEWDHPEDRAPAMHARLMTTPAVTPKQPRLATGEASPNEPGARRA